MHAFGDLSADSPQSSIEIIFRLAWFGNYSYSAQP
jgi:hypothetical protein